MAPRPRLSKSRCPMATSARPTIASPPVRGTCCFERCTVVSVAADDRRQRPVLRRLARRLSTGGRSKLSGDVLSDLQRRDLCSGDAGAGFAAAEARIVAYWADECARDLDRLMTHFTPD